MSIQKTSLPGDVRMRLEVWVETQLINHPISSSRLQAEAIIEMVEGVLTGQTLPPARGDLKPWEKYGIKGEPANVIDEVIG